VEAGGNRVPLGTQTGTIAQRSIAMYGCNHYGTQRLALITPFWQLSRLPKLVSTFSKKRLDYLSL
jgi:hypothetical protein